MRNTKQTVLTLILGLLGLLLPPGISQAAPYTLTITAHHGSVRVNPDKPFYEEGEQVELIPKPETGYSFRNWSGDVQSKRLVLNITMDSDKAITAHFGPWEPPIGIPMPEFGIFETYRMYDDPANRNPNLTYHQNEEGGYYTHYIDNTHPQATDTDNPYGSAEKPRMTIPLGVPEGSVVEIHGGPYTYQIRGTEYGGRRRLPLQGLGTAEKPVFFRGGDPNNKPIISSLEYRVYAEGTYIIIENIDGNGITIWPRGLDGDITHHIAIRHSNLHKEEIRGKGVSIGWPHGSCSSHPFYCDPTLATDIVVYNNTIHDFGYADWSYWEGRGDPKDSYGVLVHLNAYRTWIVDNHIYNIDGDAVMVSPAGINDEYQTPPRFTFIGRNIMHHCRENAIDTKMTYDTITSQNEMYDIRKAPGSDGTALVVQGEHPTTKYPYQERAWHLFNEIYDSDNGIRIQDADDVYLISNVIRDIISSKELSDSAYSRGAAIKGWRTYDVNIYNNVIYNTDLGILNAGNRRYSEVHIANNIIYNLTDNFYAQFGKQPYQVYIGSGSDTPARSTAHNNLYYQKGEPLAIRWGRIYDSVSAFQAATGQGQGSVQADPLFVDPANNNFHLQSTSPAIDAGVESDVYQTFFDLYGLDIRKDIEGRTRPQGSAWDIGAYEYTPSSFLYGDISGNGTISSTDASLAARYSVGLISLSSEQITRADVSGNGTVSASDASLIARYSVGLIDRFPVEE